MNMLLQYMKGKKKNDSISICDMVYAARLTMLTKILVAKTYIIEELKLELR